MRKPTISGLKRDLACANAEAKGHLGELAAVREEVAQLKKDLAQQRSEVIWANNGLQDRRVLIAVINDYRQMVEMLKQQFLPKEKA